MNKKIGINIRELYELKLKEARARFALMNNKEEDIQDDKKD